MDSHLSDPLEPGASSNSLGAESPDSDSNPAIPLPSGASFLPAFRSNSSLTPVVCDDRAISGLLELIVARSGLSVSEIARRLGVGDEAVRQYVRGRRTKPSLSWFVRFAAVCDVDVRLVFKGKA